MKDPDKLKELILKEVPLLQVLKDYNIHFMYNPDYIDEVQMRCPFHGSDNKPSARFYKSTQLFYCWTCSRKWDVISFIRDKESLSYVNSLRFLVAKYNIDDSSIPDEPRIDSEIVPEISFDNVNLDSLKSSIKEFRGKLPIEKYRALCYAWLTISFSASLGLDVSESVKKLENKVEGLTEWL